MGGVARKYGLDFDVDAFKKRFFEIYIEKVVLLAVVAAFNVSVVAAFEGDAAFSDEIFMKLFRICEIISTCIRWSLSACFGHHGRPRDFAVACDHTINAIMLEQIICTLA